MASIEQRISALEKKIEQNKQTYILIIEDGSKPTPEQLEEAAKYQQSFILMF